MSNYTNLILLVLFAIVSWIGLLILNPLQTLNISNEVDPDSDSEQTINNKNIFEAFTDRIINGIIAKNCLYTSVATFCMFLIVNLIKNRLKYIQVNNISIDEDLLELQDGLRRQKTETNRLVQEKNERIFLNRIIKNNSVLIQKLKIELNMAKDKIDFLKYKLCSGTKCNRHGKRPTLIPQICGNNFKILPSGYISSNNVINHYFRCHTKVESLDIFDNNKCSCIEISDSNRNIWNGVIIKSIDKSQQMCKNVFTNSSINGVRIVSTEELEKIKGICKTVKEDTKNFNNKTLQKLARIFSIDNNIYDSLSKLLE